MPIQNNKICPQCKIRRFMVKNESGAFAVVTVDKDNNIIPVKDGVNLDDYDLSILYCLGCSWKGSIQRLI